MNLHRGQKEALCHFLDEVRIEKGLPVVPGPEVREALEAQILKAPPWKGILSRSDLTSMLWRTLYGTLNLVPSGFSGALRLANEAYAEAERKLVATLTAIPRAYDLYIPLGGLSTLQRPKFELDERVCIVDTLHDGQLAHDFDRLHPRPWGPANGVKSQLFNFYVNEAVVTRYLCIREIGYGDDSDESQVVRAGLATLKHFVSLGQMYGAIFSASWERRWDMSPMHERTAAFLFAADGDEYERFVVPLPTDLMNLLHSLRLNQSKLTIFEPGFPMLMDGRERKPETPEEYQSALSRLLEPITEFLRLPPNLEDASRIRAAMEWQVDAEMSHNESVSFLQRCIGLEAVLGSDDSRRNVTERLADRYAYLLGKTESERAKLRQDFTSMYDHRSAIVHGRTGLLSEGHREAAWSAKRMLAQVIRVETKNLLLQVKNSRAEQASNA